MPAKVRNTLIFSIAILLLGLPALADRTTIRTGWNLFSVQQDVEMGRELADEAEYTLALVTDSYPNTYISALGNQLAVHAPGYKYPYQFKIVDDNAINSFALPGGRIYVTSGLMQAAQTEPQLAGVIAHEIAHVALRHGTQQVSKAYSAEVPNASRSNVSVGNVMAQLNLGFEPNSVVLKYSPEAERQADVIATQILYDTGFDPRQMALFFQKLENDSTNSTAAFFNSHPRVVNRISAVRREVLNMGGTRTNTRGDSPDLHTAQDHLRNGTTGTAANRTELPSIRTLSYRGRDFDFRYPENWRVSEDGDVLTVAPSAGIVSGELAYGMRMATFQPENSGFFGRNSLNSRGGSRSTTSLKQATDQLLNELRQSNPNMRVVREDQGGRVDGEYSMTVELANDSPLGGRETDWVVTVLRPNGLLYYFVGVAPEREFDQYRSTFERMIDSVRFADTPRS